MHYPGRESGEWWGAGYVANSVFTMRPFGFLLKITIDGSTVPSPTILTTTVARFVLFVNVQTWIVFLLTNCLF
jgi:hypothetical protein